LFLPGLMLGLLITALSFINFGIDLMSNPHLRETGGGGPAPIAGAGDPGAWDSSGGPDGGGDGGGGN
jgi:hypothetical protein